MNLGTEFSIKIAETFKNDKIVHGFAEGDLYVEMTQGKKIAIVAFGLTRISSVPLSSIVRVQKAKERSDNVIFVAIGNKVSDLLHKEIAAIGGTLIEAQAVDEAIVKTKESLRLQQEEKETTVEVKKEIHLVLNPQEADILVEALGDIDPSRHDMKVVGQTIDALKKAISRGL